jgi:hypothetical protein
MAKTLEKSETVRTALRQAPVIKPAALQWQSEGFCYREAFIRLPDGLQLSDLNESPIWKDLQATRQTSLRQWDTIRAVAFDESWIVDATVTFADATHVVLTGIKKTETPQRNTSLFEDDTYRVAWLGRGYGVVRKADSVEMGAHAFSTPDQAKAHLASLYPKRVA